MSTTTDLRRPEAAGTQVVALCRVRSPTERRMCEEWSRQEPGTRLTWSAAEAVANAGPADLITPVGVAWLGADGSLLAGAATLAGDWSAAARERIHRRNAGRQPGRARVLVGEAATRVELEMRWAERSGRPAAGPEFIDFVDRQAAIILDRADRRLRGERYRSPRAVVGEVMTGPGFMDEIRRLAGQLGRSPEGVLADVRAYLEEMASEQSPVAVDLWYRWARFLYSGGYRIDVDAQQVGELRRLGSSHPLVFLPSHRSNLDPYVLTSVLYDHGLPQNHTLGGINMAFWPLGPMGRRVGVIFIRRSFRDNEIYRFALRRYLGFLVSKRFNLEWYLEGTRSRTGKLLPPRLGLLNYLIDAIEVLDREDVMAIPTSIVYDVLPEAGEMTAESVGHVKQGEGLRWLVRYARENRGDLGAVHVRFGEPLNLAGALRAAAAADGGGGARLARSKVAFEISVRINRASVLSSPALVLFALLGVDDRALTLEEVASVVSPVMKYARVRAIEVDAQAGELSAPGPLESMLRFLIGHDLVECFDRGAAPVYRIKPERQLVAAFYRNSILHWFVPRAIVEVLAIWAERLGPGADVAEEGWLEALRLRDLLKFEFFFPEKAEFGREIRRELGLVDPDWMDRPGGTPGEVRAALLRSGMLVAHRTLRSFLEAYSVVARRLVQLGPATADAEQMVRDCLDLGRQYRLQHVVGSEEAVSSHLFRNGVRLAEQRGLIQAGPTVAADRAEFHQQIEDVLWRLKQIRELQRRRTPGAPGEMA